jgi:hypothetical protein
MNRKAANSVAANATKAEPKRPNAPASSGAALEFAWRTFENLNQWVRFSDAKAAVLLAANGAITGALVSFVTGSKTALLQNPWNILWLLAVVALTLHSACNALGSLMPQLRIRRRKKEPPSSEESSSLVFFGDIADRFPSAAQFHEAVTEALANPDEGVAEICHQVWANSKVAAVKYRRVTNSVYGLTVALLVGFIGAVSLSVQFLIEALSK